MRKFCREARAVAGALALALSLSLLLLQAGAGDASAQQTRRHGPNNAITDVDGILVGHHQRTDGTYQTGTTVVWAPGQAVGSVHIGGGWPGTINTNVLQPGKAEQKIDVAFMTGGSYYGLRVFGGIIEWLEQGRHGMPSGPMPEHVNPLVAGAVVYDLHRGGNFKSRPDHDFGVAAMKAARAGPVTQGNVGAGAGTRANGGLLLKGGIGTASAVFAAITVGVLSAVNAAGTPVDLRDCLLRGTSIDVENEFARYRPPTAADCTALKKARNIAVSADGEAARLASARAAGAGAEEHANTTLSVVATNAILTKAQAYQLAYAVNAGNAAVINPFNSGNDGDAVFAMATGKVAIDDAQYAMLLNVAKEIAGRSIAHAMLNATSVRTLQSYCDALPSACRR